ncbi:MAG TPA: response regulator [Kofleriaceae bacterium]|nr:response regulator [Kofleriaceae bacterium]
MADAAMILVVDDDPRVRQSIRDLLTGCGFAVREAGTCEAAIAAFRSQRPDIVLVEHRLPDGDGVHLIASSAPPIPTSRASCSAGTARSTSRSRR